MQRTFLFPTTTLIVLTLGLRAPVAARETAKEKERIWLDPGPVETLDTFHGAGGKEHAPDPHGKYTFVKEVLHEFNPKFDVEDEHGVRWRIKVGWEAQPETAATRLLWAAGYFVDEDYYLAEVKVRGLPRLHRGRKFVSPDGTVRGARLERRTKEMKARERWSWFDNPFLGTKEFNGLRVMMAFINNMDLKTQNNSVYEVDGERRYLVSDVGDSFGRTGNEFMRSRGALKDYARAKFVARVRAESVDFVMHTRPFFPFALDVPYYRRRARMERITRDIPRADARWLGARLARLSEEQIRDCFRAAGYSPEVVEGYAKAVEKRIADLNAP